MNSDSRAVKGLNIAIIVLAALGLLASLSSIFGVGLMGAALSDPSIQSSMMNEFNYEYRSEYNANDIMGMLVGLGAILMVCSILALPASILALIAGILALRNAAKPDKLGAAFVLTIIAIILNVLCFQLITFILLIISAVFINKVRKSAVAIPYAVNPAVPGAYQQQACAQPAQPVAPQQPTASAPSATPSAPEQPSQQQPND